MNVRTNMRSSTDDDSALFFIQFNPNCSVQVRGSTGRLTTLREGGTLEWATPEAFTLRVMNGVLVFDLRGSRITRETGAMGLDEFWEVRFPDGGMLTFRRLSNEDGVDTASLPR